MMTVTGLWLAGAGIAALAFESLSAALAFFGGAALLMWLAALPRPWA